jgi:hypothetical protein
VRRQVIVFAFCILPFFPARAASYDVDAKNGNDSNSGTSVSSPWKSIEKLNSFRFSPGDSILFKSGEVWRGELNLTSSGAEGRPIIISAYGDGPLPVISGADPVPAAVSNNDVHNNKFIGINMAGCPGGTSCRGTKNDAQI